MHILENSWLLLNATMYPGTTPDVRYGLQMKPLKMATSNHVVPKKPRKVRVDAVQNFCTTMMRFSRDITQI